MAANDTQVAGTHYQEEGNVPQHWDLAIMYRWDPFQYQITKYVMRWKRKHPTPEKKLEDLKKARHFLDKYIENYEAFLDKAADPKEIYTPLVEERFSQYLSDNTFLAEGGYGTGMIEYTHRATGEKIQAMSLAEAHAVWARQVAPGLPTPRAGAADAS